MPTEIERARRAAPIGIDTPSKRTTGARPSFFQGVRIAIRSRHEAPMNVQLPVHLDKTAFLDWV